MLNIFSLRPCSYIEPNHTLLRQITDQNLFVSRNICSWAETFNFVQSLSARNSDLIELARVVRGAYKAQNCWCIHLLYAPPWWCAHLSKLLSRAHPTKFKLLWARGRQNHACEGARAYLYLTYYLQWLSDSSAIFKEYSGKILYTLNSIGRQKHILSQNKNFRKNCRKKAHSIFCVNIIKYYPHRYVGIYL